MTFRQTIGQRTHLFRDLKDLMAKATPLRSGDQLAGIAATSAEEMVAARMVLADQPLKLFLAEPLVPYETDEVTRLILDRHDAAAFAPIAHLTVGGFRDWLLSDAATTERLAALAPWQHEADSAGRSLWQRECHYGTAFRHLPLTSCKSSVSGFGVRRHRPRTSPDGCLAGPIGSRPSARAAPCWRTCTLPREVAGSARPS